MFTPGSILSNPITVFSELLFGMARFAAFRTLISSEEEERSSI
jgi:hypothetical protein